VDGKSNEITAVPLLLLLNLKGDSGCDGNETQMAAEIQQAEGDYVLALKGNQGSANK